MLDLGFELPLLREIARGTARGQADGRFSATWPHFQGWRCIMHLATRSRRKSGSDGLARCPPSASPQIVEVVELNDKAQHLGRVLKKYSARAKRPSAPRTLIWRAVANEVMHSAANHFFEAFFSGV